MPAALVGEVGVLLEQVLQGRGGVERAAPEPGRHVLADVGEDLLDRADLARQARAEQPVVVLAVAVRQVLVVQAGQVEGRAAHHQGRAVQLLHAVLQQPCVADEGLTRRPVDVAALAHEEPDAGADGQQLGVLEQPGDLEPDLGRVPEVVVVAARHELTVGGEHPGVAGAAEPAGPGVDHGRDHAALATEAGEGLVDLLAVVDHEDLERAVVVLRRDAGEGLLEERGPTPGGDGDGDQWGGVHARLPTG